MADVVHMVLSGGHMVTSVALGVAQSQKASEQMPCIRLQAAKARRDFVDTVLFDVLSPQQVDFLAFE